MRATTFQFTFLGINPYRMHVTLIKKPSNILLADNLLWGGSVIGGKRGEGLGGIKEYTKMIFNDRRLKSLIIPLGDGLSFSYRVA